MIGKRHRYMQNTKSPILPNDIDKYVTHHYADNNGVRIHYVTIGEGQTSDRQGFAIISNHLMC
ncbi:MAG TPA: hypothetical protein VE076_08840 [Nitrososphaeraceae archaeon]|nr:hypothetical protein [Nitrososphaeraceae archaeon]